ncbi:MAG: FHA domain-containing protein [Bacteroidales bacterium]|nr:FHA domain-containing protein [Bacteroidales bacterium]
MSNIVEIKIGREDVGKGCITVPADRKLVGRHHAKLLIDRDAQSISIQEVKASNGTFVNGLRMASSGPLDKDDTVYLGCMDEAMGFKLNVRKIFDLITTDYSREFQQEVIPVYENYMEELNKLNSKFQKKMSMPRNIVMLSGAVIGLCFIGFSGLIFGEKSSAASTARLVAMSVTSVLTALVAFLPTNHKQENVKEQSLDLLLKYQDKYCCPKCGTKFNLNQHWKIIQASGCPNPKCNAQFKK